MSSVFTYMSSPMKSSQGLSAASFHSRGCNSRGGMNQVVQGEVHPRTRPETRLPDWAPLIVLVWSRTCHTILLCPHSFICSSSRMLSTSFLDPSRWLTFIPRGDWARSPSTASGLPSPPQSIFSLGLCLCLLTQATLSSHLKAYPM